MLLVCALATASAGLLAGPAQGAGLSKAVADCEANARLTQSYTINQLRDALASIPVAVNQYSICHDVLQRALDAKLAALRVSGGSGSGGGSFLPTWLLIVLVVLVLGGAGFGVAALRQRRRGP
jgi:hypothetical protein